MNVFPHCVSAAHPVNLPEFSLMTFESELFEGPVKTGRDLHPVTFPLICRTAPVKWTGRCLEARFVLLNELTHA